MGRGLCRFAPWPLVVREALPTPPCSSPGLCALEPPCLPLLPDGLIPLMQCRPPVTAHSERAKLFCWKSRLFVFEKEFF